MRASSLVVAVVLIVLWPAALAAQTIADPPELNEMYQRAMGDFAADRWEDAARGFDTVAAQTVDPSRRAAAQELAEQARRRSTPTTTEVELPPPTPQTYESPPPAAPGNAVPPPPRHDDDNDGRSELILGTTALGLTYWGFAPTAIFPDLSARAHVGLYMLVGAGSFFVPFLASRGGEVTQGEATLSIGLATAGIGVGALTYGLTSAYEDDVVGEFMATTLAFSFAGSIGGYLWADQTNMDAGTATAATQGLTFGAGVGLAVPALLLGENTFESETSTRVVFGSMLAGAGLGLLSGYHVAPLRTWTSGDAATVGTFGAVGTYVGLVPAILIDPDGPDARVVAGGALAMAALGLYLGDGLVKGVDLTREQGALVAAGAGVGWLLGAGFTYLMLSGDASDDQIMRTGASLTAAFMLGGTVLTYTLLEREAEAAAGDRNHAELSIAPTLVPDTRGGMAPGLGFSGTF